MTDETTEQTEQPKREQPGGNSNIAGERLRSFIERVERLEEEKASIATDIKEVYAEAKATGFDTTVMRAIVKLRRQDPEKRREFEAVLETYLSALGIFE